MFLIGNMSRNLITALDISRNQVASDLWLKYMKNIDFHTFLL